MSGDAADAFGSLQFVLAGAQVGPGVHAEAGALEQREDAVAATGHDEVLWALGGVRGGDFSMRARLRLRGPANAAAGFYLGEDYFGFEGARGTVFVEGPNLGKLQLMQRTEELIDREGGFDFEVRRAGGVVTYLLDGEYVHSSPWEEERIERFGFRPWRATVEVLAWSLEGDVFELTAKQVGKQAAWDVPLIDLAGEAVRQVVVDREPGQYLGHPTTLLLEDGRTMLCVYPKGHGRGAIVYKRSTDGGKTWSERLPTPESWATSKEVPTLFSTVDASGQKRVLMFSGLYPTRLAISEDDGATWGELEPVGDWGGIVVMGCMAALETGPGHYVTLFHDDGRFFREGGEGSGTFTLYQSKTTDGGVTWSEPEAIQSSSDVHLCEPGILRSPDGTRLAILLRENARRRNSHIMFSDDEARTWSEPRPLSGALNGDRHTGVYAPDGRLFVSFRDNQPKHLSSATQGDWVAWVGTWDDLVEGKSGQYRVRLGDNTKGADCAYPGVELLPDGTIVTTTYGHWVAGEEPYVLSVRLTLDELDEHSDLR